MFNLSLYYFTIPLISSFIGWMTNYVAVKMLFRPYKERNFLFIKIQGIFPKRRHALIEKLSTIIAHDLLHKEKLIDQITANPKLDELITSNIKKYIGGLINNKIKKIPLISALVNEDMVQSIEESLLSDFKEGLGPIKNEFLHEAIANLDIKKVVTDYLNSLSMKEMEELIRSVLKREFRFVEWSGAVLGFFIGICQLAIIGLG